MTFTTTTLKLIYWFIYHQSNVLSKKFSSIKGNKNTVKPVIRGHLSYKVTFRTNKSGLIKQVTS